MKAKIILLLSLLSLFNIESFSQTFYDLTFKSLKGDTIQVSHFATKKVLLMILPMSSKDSVYEQLAIFARQYGNKVQIVGVPANENGYQKSKAASIGALYNDLPMIIAEGMNSRKDSKETQSSLMAWLTNPKKNGHFGNDAVEPGDKFFVNESGRLFAVFGRQTSLQDSIVFKVLNSTDKVSAKK